MDIVFLIEAFTRILAGVPLTLQLASLSLAAGFVLACALAGMRLSGILPLNWIAWAWIFVFRGTPLLVQVFLIYYGLPRFIRGTWAWPYLREPWWCALLALSLNTAAYGAEILRGGFLSVPRGQVEAARACGMSGVRLLRRIVFPIALRQALPAYGNEMILMVKATSLASIITLMEITGLAQKLISESFRAVEVFVVAGGFYLFINFLITRAVMAMEFWLSPHLRDAPEREQIMAPALANVH
jgi:octopine/nopaline transport system permease protein